MDPADQEDHRSLAMRTFQRANCQQARPAAQEDQAAQVCPLPRRSLTQIHHQADPVDQADQEDHPRTTPHRAIILPAHPAAQEAQEDLVSVFTSILPRMRTLRIETGEVTMSSS